MKRGSREEIPGCILKSIVMESAFIEKNAKYQIA